MFPEFPVVTVSPSLPLPLLWKHVTLSLPYQRGNIAATFNVDNVTCSAVTALPRERILTLETGKAISATTFSSLHFYIFCQITEFPYGLGFMGHSV
jgi:hypothetical protein